MAGLVALGTAHIVSAALKVMLMMSQMFSAGFQFQMLMLYI